MPTAIVHEWIQARAGSEQVFEALAQTFPKADLFALSREPGVHLDVGGRPIRTTFLDRPSLRRRRGATLPLMPFAWSRLGRGRYDTVITSHHAMAHANRLAGTGRHLCYVHTPARYVWTPELDGRGSATALAPARHLLKTIDRRAARRVTAFAANSTEVARRIRRFWDRDATVIHPPVRVEFFTPGPDDPPPTRDFVLGVGRWIPYKNLHLVIEAADRAGLPAKIAGSGPDRSRILEAISRARVPVELIESPSDEDLRALYRNALALVFPTVEDFGIVAVEAQAAGTPVIAPRAGGALDTVVDGVTGALAESLDPAALAELLGRSGPESAEKCIANAARFSLSAFSARITAWTRDAGSSECDR